MKKFFALLFGLVIVILMGGCLNLEGIFPFLNKAPVIISDPIITATEDQLYSYQVEASDSNGDTLTYSSIVKPEGMYINSENGLIAWTPTNDQVGIQQVVIKISDGKQSITQSFEVEVFNINNPPQTLSYFPTNVNIKINEGNSIKFEVQANDIDLNTTLNYQWLLNGKEVSNSTGSGNNSKSSWIFYTGYGDYSQKTVKALVSDGELQDYVQWDITINDITPPAQPTLNTVTSPTNISPQILSGTKESNTSVWINGTEVVPLDSSVNWSYSYNLNEGNNDISITSRDAAGNKSASITTTIILDTNAPAVPTLDNVLSPTNISRQTLSGTKETNTSIRVNEIESVLINSDTTWSYVFDLSEGGNKISITACDAAGNKSTRVTADITLDTIVPETPTLNPVTSPTNISSQTLLGTKGSNTSVWINAIEVVPFNSSVNWSHPYNFSEGINNISITSYDAAGNESLSITTNIILDTISPIVPTLNSIISPTNISTQVLRGTKEADTAILINGTKVIPINSEITWSYSLYLTEGTNSLFITSCDIAGNESSSVITTIILDKDAPEAPTLDDIVSPTNVSIQTLSGTKETNTSIWINSLEVVPINPNNTWTYDFNLSECENNISITSRDAAGNESSPVTTTIEYDPNIYVNANNVTGIEDGTQTHPFNTITAGIDAVAPGKSVMVAEGTYNEQLIINKSITLQGTSQDNAFITGSSLTENLISLEAGNIAISGFTIDGDSSTSIGIYFDNYSFININNNLIKNNKDYGISYINSAPIIEGNNIENNSSSGIKVATNGAGIIRNNFIVSNKYGIRTYGDSCPEISRNNISNNITGIYCRESATPIISYNTISNNTGYGILIDNILGNLVNPDIGGGDGQSDGQNKITGNSIHGVSNKTTHSIMALNNWWGDAAGPKYPYHTSSSGDWAYWSGIGANIIFEPYLTTEP